MMKNRLIPAVFALGMAFYAGGARAQLTEENFVLHKTSDLVTLCSAPMSDKLYTAAVNFCEGFGVGVYGTFMEVQKANPKIRAVCLPDGVTRFQALAAFVSWANGDPARADLSPVDGVAGFLHETYPCPKAAPAKAKGKSQ